MSGITDTNIILGQGSAIKEVHNVKKQNLEINQQYAAQNMEDKKKKEKRKVQDLEKGSRILIKNDKEKNKDKKGNPEDSGKKKEYKANNPLEGNIINITV